MLHTNNEASCLKAAYETKPKRPMPTDFPEMAAKMKRDQLIKHYKTGPKVIKRWRTELGTLPAVSPELPPPADFVRNAAVMSKADLQRHYRIGSRKLARWIAESGAQFIPKATPVPADLAELAARMTQAELIRHYGVTHTVMTRWQRDTGIQPRKHIFAGNITPHRGRGNTMQLTRVKSMYDEAADVLRRERFKVNRCNDKGGYDDKGAFWRVGWSVLTADELLEKAARYERRAA